MFVNLCPTTANQVTTRLSCLRSSLCKNVRKVCEVFELLERKLTDREMTFWRRLSINRGDWTVGAQAGGDWVCFSSRRPSSHLFRRY